MPRADRFAGFNGSTVQKFNGNNEQADASLRATDVVTCAGYSKPRNVSASRRKTEAQRHHR
jgi:hypothetical protein